MDYKHIFHIVLEATNDCDPMNLLGLGAPTDEYEMEVSAIVAKLKSVATKKDLEELVISVFEKAF